MSELKFVIEKSPRIAKLVHDLYENMPEIEADRAELVTESYKQTEHLPMVKRRSAAFRHILENIPIVIRPGELIVGSNSVAPRGCQTFPEFSFEWLPPEYKTIATREADPFYISDSTIRRLDAVHPYWKGRTVSDLAAANMDPEVLDVFMNHGIFTVGNYFYNGVGHVNVNYEKVINCGYETIIDETRAELAKLKRGQGDYADRRNFLEAVIESCEAVIAYARRYSDLALSQAADCTDSDRKAELLTIAEACDRVPAKPARTFHEACQSFWFVQQLMQMESSGHSISPGRFDQYMYPFFKADLDEGRTTYEAAQELLDCIWVKLNDLNKVRDAASAEGFAGYGLFQNLIVGGQDEHGLDATNDLSYMCMEAQMHVRLPQPSLSIRVWNGSPHSLLIKAAAVTREGMGVPAFYNDEVIIPSMMSRGYSLEDARGYCIIGCVEPSACHKTDGWHDAAFFNMVRPLELVFSSGMDKGEQIGPKTMDVLEMTHFEEFFEAFKTQQEFFIEMMAQADNAVDAAHAVRCPLPFESCMIDDCIANGKSVQEGGCHYNFTGPQGFGIANVADSLAVIRKLVFEDGVISMAEMKQALADNFGKGATNKRALELTTEAATLLDAEGKDVNADLIKAIYEGFKTAAHIPADKKAHYDEMLAMIANVPKYGNDLREVDLFAREIGQTYTKPLLHHTNPRGGMFHAGLYPVSANVPLGHQAGASPDGRLANTPIADVAAGPGP
ncbi:MAG: glycyl radical protein, partial [Ruminococcaceae bacterium]|nr:glycyl radical protein [Oscillospiraceae bacterium]